MERVFSCPPYSIPLNIKSSYIYTNTARTYTKPIPMADSTLPAKEPRYCAGVHIPDDLPRPSKGRDMSKAKKLRVAKIVCEIYATGKVTIETALHACNVRSNRTWANWAEQITEIAELYKEAQDQAQKAFDKVLVATARDSLLNRRLRGELVTLTTVKTREASNQEKKDFPGILMVEETTTQEKYIPPSDTAIIFALTNKDSLNFTRNPEPGTGEDAESFPIAEWVKTPDQLAQEKENAGQ